MNKLKSIIKNSILCLKFPFLYPRNVYSDKPCHLIPQWTQLDSMPKGWRDAFGIQMCKDIKKELKKHRGLLRKYRIVQIKEKFGGLRWYSSWSTKELDDIIDKYEKLSFKTCIQCGKPAEYISAGWICPFCSDCRIDSRNYVPITEEGAWDKAYTYYWPKKEE